ncbi:hypothetical protein ASPACDRAFT_61603 [Aspergillus aculeatus ATCC 16872]|uniref:MACPF domain-containing protein n=1 Tax=Aspergillus aculeatus (strain ATCC 16872 / CBS 172.66 / WB 5094) TaxID=690307 RepID=A0A1L9WS54_ASPA1|nr:uncharacterized protein ASPACDRAFT_61603 [Aspergillus aculeatus ATCC 16872]OJJ98908.1 hypothetical protein ASPACDRAFT_61603 [Aspergillus aculeatus ATCC 16872]
MASVLQNTTVSIAKGVVDTAEKTTSAVDDNLKRVSDSLDQDKTTDTGSNTAKDASSVAAAEEKQATEILEKGTPEILHVYSYDGDTRLLKEKACIPFANPDDAGLKLSDIRQLLISEKALEPRLLSSPFTNQRGAKVADTTSFKAYLQILNEKSSELGDRIEDNADTYRVYLNSKKIIETGYAHGLRNQGEKVAVDKSAADFPVARQPTKPQEATTFSHNIFYNPATTFSIVHPADMSEKHWSVVMRNNCLLHAYRVVDVDGSKFVERALYPKAAQLISRMISATAEVDSIGEAKQSLRIPRFRIDDDSYIRQFETKKSVSRAMAEASLSETDAKMAMHHFTPAKTRGVCSEGGAFGYSASASASYSESKSSSSTSSSTQESRVMTITYNFPRVVIDFEPSGLDLSEECKFDLERVNTAAAINVFKSKYGRFFTTRVQLGGRLHNSEQSNSTDAAATAKQAKSMRAAAALSFSSPWVQASASASHSNSSDSSSEKRDVSAYSTINWEAQGGDTLQCNNPPNWAYTVGSFYNWRPIHQSKIMPLEDVISMVPGYEDTKARFAALLAAKKPEQQTIKFRLESMGEMVSVSSADNGKTLVDTITDSIPAELARRLLLSYGMGLFTAQTERLKKQLNKAEFGKLPVQFVEFQRTAQAPGQDFFIITEQGETPKYKIKITIEGKEQWLGINPTMVRVVEQALVWAGSSAENACYFTFIPADLGQTGHYVGTEDEFYIYLYDRDKNKIGYAGRQGLWVLAPEEPNSQVTEDADIEESVVIRRARMRHNIQETVGTDVYTGDLKKEASLFTLSYL